MVLSPSLSENKSAGKVSDLATGSDEALTDSASDDASALMILYGL